MEKKGHERMLVRKIISIYLLISLFFSGLIQTNISSVMAKVSKIKLNCTKKRVQKGKKIKLKVKKVPALLKKRKIIWKSSNKKVASVTQKGVVKAKKRGKATIKAYIKGNKKIYGKCIITVVNKRKQRKSKSDVKRSDRTNILITPKPTDIATADPSNTLITPKPTDTATASPPNTLRTPEPTDVPTASPESTPGISEPTKEPDKKIYTVTFIDYDDSILAERKVSEGEGAVPPEIPKRIGYIFKEWDKDYTDITEDTIVQAVYDRNSTPSIIVGDAEVRVGTKDVDVPVYINANPGVLGMTLLLQFNDEKLNLVEAVNGDAVKDVLTMTCSKYLKNDCKFTWDGQEIGDSDIRDGTIVVLRFKLKDSIEPGEYNINMYYQIGDIVDRDLHPLSLELQSGKIIVKEE